MVEDNQIEAKNSPFAIREGEVKKEQIENVLNI